MSGGGGSKKNVTVPTVNYSSGGLYGSGTAGANNSFNPTDFQKTVVNQAESAIPKYMEQLVNPSYNSEIFKAQTANRNNLAKTSFENNLMQPLAERGLTRGSSVNAATNEFGNNLANLETQAMASEDSRVNNILSNLFGYYQIPYNMMTGMQSNANQLAMAQMQAQAQLDAANAQKKGDMFGGLASGLGSMAGDLLSDPDTLKNLASIGATAASFFSDRRLKENFKLLDEVEGYKIYRFDYINGARNQTGVVAQEVLPLLPEAVGVDDSGYYFVKYGLLPEKVRRRIAELALD